MPGDGVSKVSVKSLHLPPEIESAIQVIAGSTLAPDRTALDSNEEFRKAAETLTSIRDNLNVARQKLRRAIRQEDGEMYAYTVDVTGHGLLRTHLKTGEAKVIDQLGIKGKIDTVVTDGKDMYVSFENSSSEGWFGKVIFFDFDTISENVRNKKDGLYIGFIDARNFADKMTLTLKDGRPVIIGYDLEAPTTPKVRELTREEIKYFRVPYE